MILPIYLHGIIKEIFQKEKEYVKRGGKCRHTLKYNSSNLACKSIFNVMDETSKSYLKTIFHHQYLILFYSFFYRCYSHHTAESKIKPYQMT